MNFIQQFLDDRKIDTVTVTITSESKRTDAGSVMLRHARFTGLVTRHDLDLDGPIHGGDITLRGRRKNLRHFKAQFEALDALGVV